MLSLPRWAVVGAAAVLVAAAPVLALGPGTDLDVGAVLASGRGILDGDYRPSRPPGAPVHETVVGVLDALGGTVATNLASLVAALAVVLAIVSLLSRHGVPRVWLVAAVVAANPWFLVAATSTVDFLWALAFVLWSVDVLQRGHPVPAALLAALAVGSRLTSALLVAAAVVAALSGQPDEDDAARSGRAADGPGRPWRPVLVYGALTAVLGAVAYVPAFVSSGNSLAFAQNDFRTEGVAVMVGRALSKDLYFIGPFAAVVLLLMVVPMMRALPLWRSSWPLRFGVLAVVVSEGLFVRFPWKMGHLLPLLVGLAMWAGVALARRPRLLVALVAAQLAYAVVNVQLLEPNAQNAATDASFTIDLRWGVVVTDTVCRARDTDAWEDNDRERLEAVWNCAKPFGNGP